MRIFLTGGTGYIGAAVLDAFVRAGHHVDALVRNSEKAEQVQARGASPVLGDAADPKSYADAAAAADGVVLTAFESSARGVQVDATTLDTVLATPGEPGRFIIYTSGGARHTSGGCWTPQPPAGDPSSFVPESCTGGTAALSGTC
jgi:uncharacterized protein YbjT (DUF2867 family)